MYGEIISESRQRLHVNLGFKDFFFVCEFRYCPSLAVYDFRLTDVIYLVMVGAYAIYADEICLVFYRSC